MAKTGKIEAAANAALIVSLLSAFYRGVRAPSLWSINYYIPSMFDGIYRRTLLGTLLSPLGALRFDYAVIAAIQVAVLLALLAVIMVRAWRADLPATAVVALFFVGPAGGYLFHEIGYVEQVMYLILLGLLAWRDRRFALPVLVAMLFMHEMALFTVIPLYCARCIEEERYGLVVLQSVVLLAVFGVIYAFFQTAPQASIEVLIQAIRAHRGYPLRADYYDVFRQQFTGERAPNYLYLAPRAALAVSILLAGVTGSCFLRRKRWLQHAFAACCVSFACVAPLLLGLFGWDADRWIFLSIFSSVIVLGRRGVAHGLPAVGACVLLLAFAVGGHLVYFDNITPRRLFPPSRALGFFTQDLPQLTRIPPL